MDFSGGNPSGEGEQHGDGVGNSRCMCGCNYPCACDLLKGNLHDILQELGMPPATFENPNELSGIPSEDFLAQANIGGFGEHNNGNFLSGGFARSLSAEHIPSSFSQSDPFRGETWGGSYPLAQTHNQIPHQIQGDMYGGPPLNPNPMSHFPQSSQNGLRGQTWDSFQTTGSYPNTPAAGLQSDGGSLQGMGKDQGESDSQGGDKGKRQYNNKMASRLFRERRKRKYQEIVDENIKLSNENRTLKAENQLLRNILMRGHPMSHPDFAFLQFDSCGCCIKTSNGPSKCGGAGSPGEEKKAGCCSNKPPQPQISNPPTPAAPTPNNVLPIRPLGRSQPAAQLFQPPMRPPFPVGYSQFIPPGGPPAPIMHTQYPGFIPTQHPGIYPPARPPGHVHPAQNHSGCGCSHNEQAGAHGHTHNHGGGEGSCCARKSEETVNVQSKGCCGGKDGPCRCSGCTCSSEGVGRNEHVAHRHEHTQAAHVQNEDTVQYQGNGYVHVERDGGGGGGCCGGGDGERTGQGGNQSKGCCGGGNTH